MPTSIPPAFTDVNGNNITFNFQSHFSFYMLPKPSATKGILTSTGSQLFVLLTPFALLLQQTGLVMLVKYPFLPSHIPSTQPTLSREVQDAVPEQKEIYSMASNYQ